MAVDPGHGASPENGRAGIPELHELEFAVMEQVWRLGGASVHTALAELNAADSRERAYTTVLSVLRRLHQKGFLKRDRQHRTDFYTPVISRAEYAHARTRSTVDQLVKHYGEVALAHFARQVERLSLEELAALRGLAEEEEA